MTIMLSSDESLSATTTSAPSTFSQERIRPGRNFLRKSSVFQFNMTTAVFILMTAASAVALTAATFVSAAITTALAAMASTAVATAALVHIFSVKALSELLLCSLAD